MPMDDLVDELERTMKPYRGRFESFRQIPKEGCSREEILKEMQALYDEEAPKWREGFLSGSVYHGDLDHIDFQNKVYALNSQSNPIHFDTFPSNLKFEAEIVSMTANMLSADKANEEIVGSVSSGGTESILLAMKTYRDWGRAKRWITKPEMIAPVTAHAAFDKASQYFGIKAIRTPITGDCRADVEAVRAAITKNTVVIVGSAPTFPHGVIDPIPEMSQLAREHGIGFHTDSCLGGFILPWAEKLGYPVTPFDFRLPGVTSISADTHKYGYAAKGTSVVLYRGHDLHHFQYYTNTDWPGGLYFSPTLSGSRAGALSAACWAAMVTIGEKGYLEASKAILETGDKLKKGIHEIPELYVLGEPLYVIAFASDVLDVYAVSDRMSKKGWGLSPLQRPPCVHISLTLRHTQPGVAEKLLADLREAVEYVKANPKEGSLKPVYGMAGNLHSKGAVSDILKQILDVGYSV